MKRALLLAPLLLSGCLGQETTRARYDADQQEQAAAEAKAAKVEIYWTKKPERPYTEIGMISCRTCEKAQDTQHGVQMEASKLNGDAVIITGNHAQVGDRAINLTGTQSENYIDGVAIRWKP